MDNSKGCCQKTCPTHRGLRLTNRVLIGNGSNVGRLAPLICLSSFSDDLKPRSSENIGKPAPLIGDKNQTALMVRSIKAVFASGVLSSCLDNAVLPVAEYGFFAQVQPLSDIQHLREGG